MSGKELKKRGPVIGIEGTEEYREQYLAQFDVTEITRDKGWNIEGLDEKELRGLTKVVRLVSADQEDFDTLAAKMVEFMENPENSLLNQSPLLLKKDRLLVDNLFVVYQLWHKYNVISLDATCPAASIEEAAGLDKVVKQNAVEELWKARNRYKDPTSPSFARFAQYMVSANDTEWAGDCAVFLHLLCGGTKMTPSAGAKAWGRRD
jgi:hypothetical protein